MSHYDLRLIWIFDQVKTSLWSQNPYKWEKKLTFYLNSFRTPDPNNKIGFLPIENETVNFLDVKNDGLVPGANPNHKAHQFWSRIEQKLIAINEKSNDEIHDEL